MAISKHALCTHLSLALVHGATAARKSVRFLLDGRRLVLAILTAQSRLNDGRNCNRRQPLCVCRAVRFLSTTALPLPLDAERMPRDVDTELELIDIGPRSAAATTTAAAAAVPASS